MKKIAHIVPSMTIGGVEVATQRSHAKLNTMLDYRVFYVRQKGALDCGQEPVWKLFKYWLSGHWRPDIVITSLWWSHALGRLFQALGVTWAAFFHNSAYSHLVDKLMLQWAWKHAAFRLVDSGATETAMNLKVKRKANLVPYVFPPPRVQIPWDARKIDFIWAGRSAAVKRVDLLIRFLGNAESHLPYAKVVIAIAGQITPALAEFVRTSKLHINIKQDLLNSEVLAELSSARFYLLFSDHEGMSMSTVEAIQAGCVAVVRRVGEIPTYLNESDCVSISDDSNSALELAVKSVAEIIRDSEVCEVMRSRALSAIKRIPYYSDSLLCAVQTMNHFR